MIVSLFVLFNYILGLVKKNKNNTKKDVPCTFVNEDNDLTIVSKIQDLIFESNNTQKDVPCTFVEEDNDSTIISNIQELIFEGDAEISDDSVQFFPPAYRQRYKAVLDVIESYKKIGNIRKIIDFGCGELSFFSYIKHLEGIEEYIGVDIDEDLLLRTYSRAVPLTADYLTQRCSPLKVSIFKGSVTDADARLKDSNVVIAIELIEHMYPNELNDLPYNIFGVIQPKIAIFTTPNSEFNVFFPNFTGFRHPDHKFEWTRKEFEDWANNIAERFPYNVVFHGIGRGPAWTEPMGCCSQMAVFIRNSHRTIHVDVPYSEIYKCIHQLDYPFQTLEDKLNDTLEYEFFQFLKNISDTDEYVVDQQRKIPVDDLLRRINVNCSNEILFDFLKRTEKNVEYINNKATLILPYVEDPYTSEDDSYVCDGSAWENKDYQEDKESHEYWDVDCSKAVEEKMKSNESEDELDWGAPNITPSFNGTPNTHEVGGGSAIENATSEPLKNEFNIPTNSENGVIPDIVDINKKQLSDSAEKCKYTGTIPKQRVIVSEYSSSTSVSSDEATVLLERCTGTTNIHKKSSVFPENLISCGSEESFSDYARSSTILFYKYPSSDIITTYNFDKTPEISDNFDYTKAGSSSGAGLPLSRTLDKVNGKLIKCQNCGQMYINKHNCLGINDQSNTDVPEETSILKVDKHLNGTKNSELSSSSSVHRSHSLGNVNIGKGMCKNFRYSLNIDNKVLDCDTSVVDMDLEVCCKVSSVPSLTDTFGSHSKAADSGYPNSVHDMDLDLTPEQVDEIITETESSLEDEDSSGDEGADQVPGNAPIVFLDNVENGDVANNNRDGEGNNMEGGEVAEVLGFEGLVLEGEEVEAEQHASDDEGLYLSALDTSNDTVIPEENLSHDETLFNSFFEGPSSSSVFRTYEIECMVHPVEEQEECDGFPMWLSNILIDETNNENRDSGICLEPSAVSNLAENNSSILTLEDLEAQVEIIVPVDIIGGGDSSSHN